MAETKLINHQSVGVGSAQGAGGQLAASRDEYGLEEARDRAKAISIALRKSARKSRAPVTFISGGGGLKARRGDRRFFQGIILSFILMVALPFIAASIYLPLFASDQYASEARFAVRSRKASPLDSMIGMASLGSSQQMQESQIIANYLRSRAVVDELEAKFDLRSIFGSRDFDYLFRFDVSEPKEELVKYWRRQVTVDLDRNTGITSLEVRAFKAADALAICAALIQISERMVNDLTDRARRDALGQAEDELRRHEQRLEQATAAMRDVRNREGVLDAEATAASLNEVISRLRLSLAGIEQELDANKARLSPSAPQLRYMNAQAQALRDKIGEYERQIASANPGSSSNLSASAGALDRQRIEVKIAQEQYGTSLAGYEKARAELDVQGSYLLTFLQPRLAEEAEYPRRWLIWSSIVLTTLVLWAMMLGMAMLVRDHMAS